MPNKKRILPFEHKRGAKHLVIAEITLKKLYAKNKDIRDCVIAGKYNLKALKSAYEKLDNKHHPRVSLLINKTDKKQASKKSIKDEIREYLDEKIEVLAACDIRELQRRNELEKLLLAQINRKKLEATLIESDKVMQAEAFAGRIIKENLTAIPDRVCAILAAEGDAFKVKNILLKEINFVLDSISRKVLNFHANATS